MEPDKRGFRVALVADEFVNAVPQGLDVLALLERAGWGAILLPPAWYPDDIAAQLLEQIAEHVDEFARHRYDLILIGAREGLAETLDTVGAAVPDEIVPGTEIELQTFLSNRATSAPAHYD